MAEKRFKVRDGHLSWYAPDRFEISATLHITDSGAFREFVQEYNRCHPDLVENADKETSKSYSPAMDKYLSLLIEEYLHA